MTRVTNLGFKRKYLQAGFESNPDGVDLDASLVQPEIDDETHHVKAEVEESNEPPKKKRKRSKKKKDAAGADTTKADAHSEGGENDNSLEEGKEDEGAPASNGQGKTKRQKTGPSTQSKTKKAKRQFSENFKGKLASEKRRLKRIDARDSDKICFACRQKGHSARDCPSTVTLKTSEEDGIEGAGDGEQQGKKVKMKIAAGICYRCGSKRHNLSRCKKPIDSQNPLPFALCFVCGGKGHLASTCSQNKGKGVYPNGGCCKLCGETSHLARDCHLRKSDNQDATAIYGTGREAGADEDDFHILKRRTREVDRDEKREEKRRKSLQVKAGVQSGTVKSFGSAAPIATTKKVVYF